MLINLDMQRETLIWRWRHFNVFSGPEWHRLLALRTAIFVVEQNCPYQEVDAKDPLCWHLEVIHERELIGTLRVVPPGISYEECAIGRVAVSEAYRGLGLGYDLMNNALGFCGARWAGGVRLSAQAYLRTFYESIGFSVIGESYLEDDIPHIEMLKASAVSGG